MTVRFITAVWGPRFLELYARVAVPNQIAPSNLPALARPEEASYHIYTAPADVAAVEASPAVARLRRHVAVEVHAVAAIATGTKYDAMKACHDQALVDAASDKAAVCFLSPDHVWASGALPTLERLARGPHRVVMVASSRIAIEGALPSLEGRRDPRAHTIEVPARELVGLFLDYQHPWTASCHWEQDHLTTQPSHLYWRAGLEGIVARCFHLHPAVVRPRDYAPRYNGTLDFALVEALGVRRDEIRVIEDSDQLMVAELSPSAQTFRTAHLPTEAAKWRFVAGWAKDVTLAHHRDFARVPIRLRRTDPTPVLWRAAERRSGRALRGVLATRQALRLGRGLRAGPARALGLTRSAFQGRQGGPS